MKKILKTTLLSVLVSTSLLAESINLNFENMKIMDLVKITSKIIDKNIVYDQPINGNVNYINNSDIKQEDLINLLAEVLKSKGYVLLENKNFVSIVKSSAVKNENAKVVGDEELEQLNDYEIVTYIKELKTLSVNLASAKTRHLVSTTASYVIDNKTNMLIITDYVQNLKTVKKVIDKLSGSITNDEIEIIFPKTLSAEAMRIYGEELLKSKYDMEIAGNVSGFIVNKIRNSVTVFGKKEILDYIKAEFNKTIEDEKSEDMVVIQLQNEEAAGIIGTLNTLYKNLAKYVSWVDLKEGNAIALKGREEEVSKVKEIIKSLDLENSQVYVQARIIEISESKSKEIGVKYGLLGGSAGSSGLFSFATALGGSALPISTSSIGLDIPNLSQGIALGASINLLNNDGALEVVSEPSLLCLNNKTSSIYIGETKSIKTSSTTNATSETIDSQYKREDIGLKLEVKPRISSGNKVLLDIKTTMEDVRQTVTNGQPDTSKKEINTVTVVNNGESVIIGGMIKEKEESQEDSVPFLSSLPIIGDAFKNDNTIKEKINLVIVITPYIVPKSKDLTFVRDQLVKLKNIEESYLGKFYDKKGIKPEKIKELEKLKEVEIKKEETPKPQTNNELNFKVQEVQVQNKQIEEKNSVVQKYEIFGEIKKAQMEKQTKKEQTTYIQNPVSKQEQQQIQNRLDFIFNDSFN